MRPSCMWPAARRRRAVWPCGRCVWRTGVRPSAAAAAALQSLRLHRPRWLRACKHASCCCCCCVLLGVRAECNIHRDKDHLFYCNRYLTPCYMRSILRSILRSAHATAPYGGPWPTRPCHILSPAGSQGPHTGNTTLRNVALHASASAPRMHAHTTSAHSNYPLNKPLHAPLLLSVCAWGL